MTHFIFHTANAISFNTPSTPFAFPTASRTGKGMDGEALKRMNTKPRDDFQDGFDAYKRKDYKTAYKLWLPLAEQGDADAQSNLGWMYENGQGVPQDYKEAVKWYRLSAEQGDAFTQNNLGMMYDNGQGVPQDYKEAVRWFHLSAEQGFAQAQSNLGVMYATGRGVPQDDKEAVNWFRLSAEQGLAQAQYIM